MAVTRAPLEDWRARLPKRSEANLAEMWGVHDRNDWRNVSEAKLAEQTDNLEHVAVDLRRQAGATNHAGWLKAIDEAANMGRVPLHSVPALVAAADRITGYEDRFRADGLITGVVPMSGVRRGRAVKLARWDCGTDTGPHPGRERVLASVRCCVGSHCRSWADRRRDSPWAPAFFDEEDFPGQYGPSRAHRSS